MAFQINSNVTALNVYNNLGVHQAKSSAALARISSGLKAAGGGDIASQGTAATLNAALQATQSSISQVQSAINQSTGRRCRLRRTDRPRPKRDRSCKPRRRCWC